MSGKYIVNGLVELALSIGGGPIVKKNFVSTTSLLSLEIFGRQTYLLLASYGIESCSWFRGAWSGWASDRDSGGGRERSLVFLDNVVYCVANNNGLPGKWDRPLYISL